MLLDAFRHDYLARTRFLADISRRSLLGRLEEPFGFCPRGAYFGGLTPAQQGYTNMLHYDPNNSVFRWARELSGMECDGELLQQVRSIAAARARAQLPAFSARYVDPLAIPLEYLAYFDVSERHAPWDEAVGYRSLFHILNEHRRSWLEVSWPFATLSGGASSAEVAGEALHRLRDDHAFAYIHLPSLDTLGHRYGPGAIALQRAIEETDRLCEIIAARILELHRDPVILFAGDHGMVSVVKRVDVWGVIAKSQLRFGRDIVYFVDSTMVRCWFLTAPARRLTMDALGALGCGHWITSEERRRWGLEGLPARNGEEFFLADAGVVFSPSFFAGEASPPPRGMHGYAPEVLDNQAVFVAHRPRTCWAGSVGTVEARRIFPSLLRWLGWDSASYTAVAPIDERHTDRAQDRWTQSGSAETEATVAGHMLQSVQLIREKAEKASAIVLTGGFGRGEGTATIENGVPRLRNDYDLVVVGGKAGELDTLGETLARKFGIEFVDVGRCDQIVAPKAVTQSAFDLRYGSRVLWGDPLAVERLPRYAPEELGPDEGIYLLGNRFCGLALALTGRIGEAFGESSFFMHQLAKFLIAVVDAWLIELGDYHSLYQVRRRRFAELAAGAGFDSLVATQLDRAFAYKIDGIALSCDAHEGARIALMAFDELARVLCWKDARAWFAQRLEAIVARRGAPSRSWIERAEQLGLALRGGVREDTEGARARIYRGCVTIVYRHSSEYSDTGDDWRRILGSHWEMTPSFEGARSVAAAWLAQFH